MNRRISKKIHNARRRDRFVGSCVDSYGPFGIKQAFSSTDIMRGQYFFLWPYTMNVFIYSVFSIPEKLPRMKENIATMLWSSAE